MKDKNIVVNSLKPFTVRCVPLISMISIHRTVYVNKMFMPIENSSKSLDQRWIYGVVVEGENSCLIAE